MPVNRQNVSIAMFKNISRPYTVGLTEPGGATLCCRMRDNCIDAADLSSVAVPEYKLPQPGR
jgi:hypothetical protein